MVERIVSRMWVGVVEGTGVVLRAMTSAGTEVVAEVRTGAAVGARAGVVAWAEGWGGTRVLAWVKVR